MNNLALKYEKAFELKKFFDDSINTKLTVKQNSENLENNKEFVKQFNLYCAHESGIDLSNALEAVNYINSVEFGNKSDRLLSQFLYMSHYTQSGKIKIVIDKLLVEQLNNTKLDNLFINDIIFPFNSFYLSLNEFSYIFTSKDFHSNLTIKINGVYVVKTEQEIECTFLTNNQNLNFLRLIFPCNENELNTLITTHSTIRCNTQEELEKYSGHQEEDAMLQKYASVHYDLSELSHLVFSILLYLSSFWNYKEDRIIQSFDYDKLTKQATKSNTNATKLAIKYANAENIIKLKMTEQERVEATLHKESYKLKSLFIVRGHWRKQPIGEKKENKHKIIWIKPFWKGEGNIQGKTYKV